MVVMVRQLLSILPLEINCFDSCHFLCVYMERVVSPCGENALLILIYLRLRARKDRFCCLVALRPQSTDMVS